MPSVPTDYEPYRVTTIGSNENRNGRFLFEVNGNHPILIGRGQAPKLWLRAPTAPHGAAWATLVKNNTPMTPSIVVSARSGHLAVQHQLTHVIKAFERSPDHLEIEWLDLRPFGLAIYADRSGLNVGGSVLKGNTFDGVRTMIGIG